MIKTNELRIGSYYKFQHITGRLQSFKSNDIVELYVNDRLIVKCDYEVLAPIPLSEEWLARFGFTMVNMGGWKYKNLEFDNITTEEYYETEFKLTVGDWILKPLKYVHELQNYFFAIYCEELTVKHEE